MEVSWGNLFMEVKEMKREVELFKLIYRCKNGKLGKLIWT